VVRIRILKTDYYIQSMKFNSIQLPFRCSRITVPPLSDAINNITAPRIEPSFHRRVSVLINVYVSGVNLIAVTTIAALPTVNPQGTHHQMTLHSSATNTRLHISQNDSTFEATSETPKQ
jgi:hypothetical protein